jgi:8-oxo-dGTP pyrophosphatase MutT (NUDIX family)
MAGESSRKAASRELREETGLAVSPNELTHIDRFAETSALLDFYIADEPAHSDLSLQVSEVAAAEWVSVDDVERRLELGLMAEPWVARLATLWPLTLRAFDTST